MKDWTQDPRLDPSDGLDALQGAYADAVEAEIRRDLQQERGDVIQMPTRLRLVSSQQYPDNNDGDRLPPIAA